MLWGCAGGGAARDPASAREAFAGEEVFSLSDRTRSAFALSPTRIDSIQFFTSGPIAYVGWKAQTDRSARVDSGAPMVSEQRTVRRHRVEIKTGTPGVVVGGDFTSSPWTYLDVDFGGFVVRFEAGRGGRVMGTPDEEGARPVKSVSPVLYYAPASNIRVDGLIYRLDRRAYTGATLAFRGTYRYTEVQEKDLWAPAGLTLGRGDKASEEAAPPVAASEDAPSGPTPAHVPARRDSLTVPDRLQSDSLLQDSLLHDLVGTDTVRGTSDAHLPGGAPSPVPVRSHAPDTTRAPDAVNTEAVRIHVRRHRAGSGRRLIWEDE